MQAAGTAAAQDGPFMLTLCRLAQPVSIAQPQSPHLKPFTFFMSRSRDRDGAERIYLHMGYFGSHVEAQKWLERLRRTYPDAIASAAPEALLRQPNSGVPILSQPEQGQIADSANPAFPSIDDTSLTDTQVISILETRGTNLSTEADRNDARVAVLKPEDTSTRHALRSAVASGAPVSFAVQLYWSVQSIDPDSVPALEIFSAYTLYSTKSCREGRSCHFLRLGFFRDAVSAKQVALHLRSSFASAAVVPVTERELTDAGKARIDLRPLSDSFKQHIDQTLASDVRSDANESSGPAGRRPGPLEDIVATASERRSAIESEETIEQTLEMLAESELWTDEGSPSETGVRHLAISVEKRGSRRS